MSFNFSCVINTICLALLGEMKAVMLVYSSFVSWIMDYLIGRPQDVCAVMCVREGSQSHRSSAGHCPLSFSLHLVSHQAQLPCGELAFPEIPGWPNGSWMCQQGVMRWSYRADVDNYVTWCEENLLQIHTDNKLDWGKNTDALRKRQLRSLDISRTMSRMFYESVVASAVLSALVCISASHCGAKLRKENASQRENHHEQCVRPSPRQAPRVQKFLQLQTDCTKIHHWAPQGIVLISGNQPVQLLSLSVRLYDWGGSSSGLTYVDFFFFFLRTWNRTFVNIVQ